MTVFDTYQQAVFTLVKKTGDLVSKDQAEARMNVCRTINNGKPCEFLGEVEPLPFLKCEGCTQCGCPLGTKAFMADAMGNAVTCPHPTRGNLWEPVDDIFKSKN